MSKNRKPKPAGRGWRPLLAKLVQSRGTDLYPLTVFEIPPPAGGGWPPGVPSCPALRDFYGLCDGGNLSLQYTFLPLAGVAPETDRWRAELPKLEGDGNDWWLEPGRHAVFGTDSGGALLVWDAAGDRVSTLYWRGGDWEPLGLSFEQFLEALFFDPARVQADDMWAEALTQLTPT